MSWIFYIFISVNLFSLASIFDKFFVSKKFKNIYSFAVVLNILYLIFIVVTTMYLRDTFVFGWPFFWAAVSGLIYFFMWIFWWKALTTGEVSRVSAIFFTQPLWNAFLAVIFLKESLSSLKWLAIIFIVTGAILSFWENKKTKSRFNRAYIFALFAGIISAFGNTISKYAMTDLPALTVQIIGYFAGLPLFLIFLRNKQVFQEVKKVFFDLKSLLIMFLRSAVGYAAICTFMLAVGTGQVSLVSALNGVQPLAILIYSTLISIFLPKFIKEENSRKTLFIKAIAIIMIVIGAVIISLTN